MIFSDCLLRKKCTAISPACGEESSTYNCYLKDKVALAPSKAHALWNLANEFEGIAIQIKEYVSEEHPAPPMIMDVQEFYERYKKLLSELET